jgi:hypothetical protein
VAGVDLCVWAAEKYAWEFLAAARAIATTTAL